MKNIKLSLILLGLIPIISLTSCNSQPGKYLKFVLDHQTKVDVANHIFDYSIQEKENNFDWKNVNLDFKKKIIEFINVIDKNLDPLIKEKFTISQCIFDTGMITCNKENWKSQLLIKDNDNPTIIAYKNKASSKQEWVTSTIVQLLIDQQSTISISTLNSLKNSNANSAFIVKKDEFYNFYKGEKIEKESKIENWYQIYDGLFKAFDMKLLKEL